LIGAGSLGLLAATFVFWPFRFGYDSVCSQCGATRETTELSGAKRNWRKMGGEEMDFLRLSFLRRIR
jgi:hypothetical protein